MQPFKFKNSSHPSSVSTIYQYKYTATCSGPPLHSVTALNLRANSTSPPSLLLFDTLVHSFLDRSFLRPSFSQQSFCISASLVPSPLNSTSIPRSSLHLSLLYHSTSTLICSSCGSSFRFSHCSQLSKRLASLLVPCILLSAVRHPVPYGTSLFQVSKKVKTKQVLLCNLVVEIVSCLSSTLHSKISSNHS
jgi:hypothetical protein